MGGGKKERVRKEGEKERKKWEVGSLLAPSGDLSALSNALRALGKRCPKSPKRVEDGKESAGSR